MVDLVTANTSLQPGDAAVVKRAGVPANVLLKDGAIKSVGTTAGDLAAGNRGLPDIGTAGQVLTTVGGAWVPADSAGGGGGGPGSVQSDPAPILGGNLDTDIYTIIGWEKGIDIQPFSAILSATTASFTTTYATKLTALPDAATLTTQLGAKAAIASPSFSGTPLAPTAADGTNTTQIATTAFVQGAVAGLDVDVLTEILALDETDSTTALNSLAQGVDTPDGVLAVIGGNVVNQPFLPPSGASDRLFGYDNLGAFKLFTYAEALAAMDGTTVDVAFGTLQIGHPSDTTITRHATGIIAVEGLPLFPNLPLTSVSAAKTFTLAELNQGYLHPSADTTARVWTIPANASVAAPIGSFLTFVNDGSAGNITIAITTDTLVWSPTGGTGSRTLAPYGMATALKKTSTSWLISGGGLT